MTRNDVITQACEQCLKELYIYATPKIEWEQFILENKEYNKKAEEWNNFSEAYLNKEKSPEIWEQYKLTYPDWKNKSKTECIGPKPFEFYYLPKEILKEICDNYIYAYRLDEQQELIDIIEILKNYCKEPIVDKYVESHTDETGYHPGYKDYEHIDNLKKEIQKLIQEYDSSTISEEISEKCCSKFFEFLDMAGEFYNWNRHLNSFNMSVYLGPSPNSNKEAVIKNWKKYKNKDIEINEELIKKEYYGDDE